MDKDQASTAIKTLTDNVSAAVTKLEESSTKLAESQKQLTDAQAEFAEAKKSIDEDAIRGMISDEFQKQAEKTSPDDASNTGAPHIAQFAEANKFDNLTFGELAVAHKALSAAAEHVSITGCKEGPSKEMTFALAARAVHDGQTQDITHAVRTQMRKQHIPTKPGEMKSYAAKFTAMHKDFPREALKANELERTTLTNYGDEWAGVAYSNTLWEEIEHASNVLSMMPTFQLPDGVESAVIPVEAAPPSFYRVAQATSQAANPGYTNLTVQTSRLGTQQVRANSEKIGAGVTWTGEINEDLIVNFVPILMAALSEEAGHVFDSMLIDSDTDLTATNINTGAVISSATHPNTAFVGFRKASFDTGKSAAAANAFEYGERAFLYATAQEAKVRDAAAVDAITNTALTGGSSTNGFVFDPTHIMDMIPMFGQAGADGMDPSKVFLLSNIGLDFEIHKTAPAINRDYSVYGMSNGRVNSIYGYPYMCSIDFARQNTGRKVSSTGVISATSTANTRNAIIAVRKDQWFWVMKRMMSMEVERVPRADAFELTMMTRVGITSRTRGSRAVQLYNFK